MGSIPIISLLVVVSLSLLEMRIGTVALTFTGLSRELARFQARSAFLGVGFTTSESERILEHPVRRRIVMVLMLLGNAGFVAAISSIIPVFISGGGSTTFFIKFLWLVSGLLLLWAISASQWVDRQLSRVIERALKRWTRLDVWDYSDLLQLGSGYSVREMRVESGDWVEGKTLADVRLGDEGVQVLGIRRATGDYVGAPVGTTGFIAGDEMVVYGQTEHVAELDRRQAGERGDRAHEMAVKELRRTVLLQETEEIRALRRRYAEDEAEPEDGS